MSEALASLQASAERLGADNPSIAEGFRAFVEDPDPPQAASEPVPLGTSDGALAIRTAVLPGRATS